MRAALLLLLLGGCAERALDAQSGPLDAGPDASVCGTPRVCTESATHTQFSLDGVCVTPGGDLEITGKPLSLGFCHCLHGCGPGIDGAIELTIANHAPYTHVLLIADVLYTSVTQPMIVYEDIASAGPGLRRMYACPGEPQAWDGRIVSGTTERLVIPQHFDVMGEPAAGDYRVRVQLSVEQELRWFEIGTMTMPLDPSCH